MDEQDPRRLLADRLRSLRVQHWPDQKITQLELACALGGDKALSVPLISSWESQTAPRIPPQARLEDYAAVFATPRSFSADQPRLLRPEEMTGEEQRAMAELGQDLMRLRQDALRASSSGTARSASAIEESLRKGFWRYADGNSITIVCAQWPRHLLERIPYTERDDPDYIEMLSYSELDALFELYGHLRAANPANQVNLRIAGKLHSDDYSSHLISLGGVDWNTATSSALEQLDLPVRQVADWESADGQYFEVDQGAGESVRHRAVLERTQGRDSAGAGTGAPAGGAGGKGILREDVALFARAISPYNRKRTVTICNGMYGRGTYGVVRALTDTWFRDRNAEYLQSRFGGTDVFCLLSRVPIIDGATLTPDWTTGSYTLFEWPG